MRFLSVFILIAACFVCSSGSVGSKSAAEQPDISKSGSNFLEICSDQRDRMICTPHGITAVQIIRVIKKYIADNPDKTHRATRYVASLALAHAFPCKAGK